MTQIIAVIDYGMGNLRSVVKALEYVADKSAKVILTDKPERVANADRVVFPGQGAARDCMRALGEHGLDKVVRKAAVEKPFLGICMGLQVLMTHSEENDGTDLLNLYSGEVKHFPRDFPSRGMKIPHMGWNTLHEVWPHPLFKNIADGSYFYFVHSYYVSPQDENLMVGKTEYGIQYAAAIARENVFAIQCHPEKSAESGLQLLKNFIHWDGQV
jgi:glutamine amidotransferase